MSDLLLFENKEKLEEEFLSFLHNSNFPEDSIFRGPSFQLKEPLRLQVQLFRGLGRVIGAAREEPLPCYADLAILDLQGLEYAALIEFRLKLNEPVETEMAEFFGKILNCLETKPPVFLVVPLPDSGFCIYQLRENNRWQELPKINFPHYATLVAGHAAEKNLTREAKQGKSLDRFTLTCHTLAGVLGLLAVASIGGLTDLTATELLLLFLAALLLIAPFTVGFRLSHGKPKSRLLGGK
jgi:hypothetical protein